MTEKIDSKIHPVDKFVGKKLRVRRTLLGFTQEKMAELSGLTFQQIQKYEKGLNRIGSSRLYQFSKICNVPIYYFFQGYDEQNQTDSLTQNNEISSIEQNPGFAEKNQDLNELENDISKHEKVASRETLELVKAYYAIKEQNMRKKILEVIRILGD